jgi:predicted porin
MDKKILSTAIAGVLAGSMAFAANADVTLYGQIDLSIDAVDVDGLGDDVNMNSNYSALGVKGSEDLGNGLKAIFMAEFQYDSAGLTGGLNGSRDQWIGLDGSFGKVRFGGMSTPYKATGAMIDPLWRTALDSRDTFLASNLHSGTGEDGEGRMTRAIGYDTPDFNGLSGALTYSFDDDCGLGVAGCPDDDAWSAGVHYNNGPILAFFDYITSSKGGSDEAYKVGGKYSFGDLAVFGQYEFDKGMLSNRGGAGNLTEDGDLWQLGASFTMGNAVLVANYGMGDDDDDVTVDTEYDVWRVGGMYNFSKRTMAYAGFAQADAEAGGESDQFSVGMRHKF